MATTPFSINASYKPADFIVRKSSDMALGMKLVNDLCSSSLQEETDIEPDIKDYIIVVGFVFSGKAVSKPAKTAEISYIIVESDPETVKQEK
jgi:CPA2 family monovalent cation:H+ antiporter-2